MARKKFETNNFWDPSSAWNRLRKIVGKQIRHLELTNSVKDRIEGGHLIQSSKSEFSRYWNSMEVKKQNRHHHAGKILSNLGKTDSNKFNAILKSEFSLYFDIINHEITDQNEEKIIILNLINHLISERERITNNASSLEKRFIRRQVQILKGRRNVSLDQLFIEPKYLKIILDLLEKHEIELVQKRSDGSFRRGCKTMVAVFANVLTKKGYLVNSIHANKISSRIKTEAFSTYFGIKISDRLFNNSYISRLPEESYHKKFHFISQYYPISSKS